MENTSCDTVGQIGLVNSKLHNASDSFGFEYAKTGPGLSYTCLDSITIILACLFVITLLYGHRKKPKRTYILPPGPKPWPIIGSAHLLDGYDIQFEGLTKLREQYGDIFSFKMGSWNCVILNTFEQMQDAFRADRDDVDGRPNFRRFAAMFNGHQDNGNISLFHT